jgi:hypothetical protein
MGRQGNFLDRINMIKRIRKVAVAGPATVLLPSFLNLLPSTGIWEEKTFTCPLLLYSFLL